MARALAFRRSFATAFRAAALPVRADGVGALVEGDTTFEGDTANDGGNAGGISREEGRTNG